MSTEACLKKRQAEAAADVTTDKGRENREKPRDWRASKPLGRVRFFRRRVTERFGGGADQFCAVRN